MTLPRQVGIPGLESPPAERYEQIMNQARKVAWLKARKDQAAGEYALAVKELDAMLKADAEWPAQE